MREQAAAAPSGFDAFVRERYAELRRLAFLLTGEWTSADDAVQTALIRCERRWGLIGEPQQYAYVRKAVLNATRTWRLRRRLHQPLSDLDGVASVEADSDSRLTVLAALSRLPLAQRQVLVLRYYSGMSEAEIAEALGVSAGTVKSRASRGLAALRASDLRVLVGEVRR